MVRSLQITDLGLCLICLLGILEGRLEVVDGLLGLLERATSLLELFLKAGIGPEMGLLTKRTQALEDILSTKQSLLLFDGRDAAVADLDKLDLLLELLLDSVKLADALIDVVRHLLDELLTLLGLSCLLLDRCSELL